jgi:hypothetical protein
MNRDIHQSALAAGLNVRNYEYRLGPKLGSGDQSDAALSLGHKHLAGRQPREGPWNLKTGSNRFHSIAREGLHFENLVRRERRYRSAAINAAAYKDDDR